ncbi:MAG TPA: Fe-S cluster assembly protein SufD [Methylomirabilota bacterium]|nr:Fe-S cluster assembly protein SufD [Methylomirabilota bacterium]
MTDRTTTHAFLAAFAARERAGMLDGPSWLREQRRSALARFGARGLPTTRDEEWKYTSLAPIAATPFDLVTDASDALPTEEALGQYLIGPSSWNRLVFVNERYVAKLSTIRPVPPGGLAGSLAEAVITAAEQIRPRLDGVPEEERGTAFGALNAAFWTDGAVLHVPRGVSLDEPIQLLFVSTASDTPHVQHPRNLIVLEQDSRATVVESYVAPGQDAYLTNAMTDVALGPGARLEHARIVLESRRAFHVGRTRVRQHRDSRLASCSLIVGGRLVRHEVDAHLDAEGVECRLGGLFVISGDQHVDINTVVDHAQPRATSRQLHKGILDGHARGVFNGRLIVRPGANGTDAHQTNKNLLLSDGVEVDSKPRLEIFADDVKCGHGAADGQLAADAVFYLKSRGLDEAGARTLLTRGFANEVLGWIGIEAVRGWCENALAGRLQGGHVVEQCA